MVKFLHLRTLFPSKLRRQPGHVRRDGRRQGQMLSRHRMVQIQSVGVEGRPGDQVRVLFPVQPVPCQGQPMEAMCTRS